ncbi:NADPH-dependent F420 reductase [Brevibacterium sp.]|uniref:NADPH-dependent F420 reductase n=1 Tax=Brevibacterium sp. TaxID=1701 RepID=UPI0026478AF1|nr:NAD(P)-binding domain-containing protein [Brevibacterium sp.]MDN5807070.1 NAD(P)-binding domain-containing protein [Brevibacterium sp.]MDN6605414.1 NAD(P)-binding domain-containing protein [Brevibacterium sp.]
MSRIGIIGAGTIGGILARKLGSVGHEVRIANSKDPSTLEDFDAPGVTPKWAAEAVDGVDIAILSLPQAAISNLSEEVLGALSDVPIVVDTGNYYPARDGRISALDDGTTDSAWVAENLGRPVFKAFNNIGGMSLLTKGTESGADNRVALSVAGSNGSAKQTVLTLIDEVGFDPVDGGSLDDSWRQQPGTPAYCADLSAEELRGAIDGASESETPKYHANRDQQDPVGGTEYMHRLIRHGQMID